MLQGREVEDGDVFRYNADFTAALFRVKINAIQLKDTVEENKKTNDQVLQDRQYQARLPRLAPLDRCWSERHARHLIFPLLHCPVHSMVALKALQAHGSHGTGYSCPICAASLHLAVS
jgi:cullin-4